MIRRMTPDAWAAAAMFEIVGLCALPLWKFGAANVLVFGLALPFVLIDRRMRVAAAAGRSLLSLQILAILVTLAIGALLFVFDMVKWGYWKLPAFLTLMLLVGCLDVPVAKLITVHF